MESAGELHADRPTPSAILGYLNFSDGRPDVKFLRAFDDALTSSGGPPALAAFRNWLLSQAEQLHKSGSAAFKDISQVQAVIGLALEHLPIAYRDHHRDLLAHQRDDVLFNSFFLARACEAVLAQGAPWAETPRILEGALKRLNDYVGHRPIAILETRANTEFYPHERLRPIPLYIKNVGSAHGPYQAVVDETIRILRNTPESLCEEAWFHLEHVDELAFDPRAYDHGHPVNRRPNYLFGEWDPHAIDNKGNYRRFVVRQTVLDALIARVNHPTPEHQKLSDPTKCLVFEAAAVLAGTILMASGVCGSGPNSHDSEARLATLVPDVAKYRDRFYSNLLNPLDGEHGKLLKAETSKLKQPFGGIRQHLNQELAKQRAAQLQNQELALILADLGYPEASRDYARRIPTTSARILSEIAIRHKAAEIHEVEEIPQAAKLLTEVEELVFRGIACGALADPWNILGYQGLYPLFQSREDSTHDPRNEELIEALMIQFDLYARLLALASSHGDRTQQEALSNSVRKLAAWWDQFAAYEVNDIPRLHGGERAEAAMHVAESLAAWEERKRNGETSSKDDITFWRDRREGFTSTAAFSQVIDALIVQQDWRASMALMIAWLSESDEVPLEDGSDSFHDVAANWLEGVIADKDPEQLIPRFFALLAANSEEYWEVPEVPGSDGRRKKTGKSEGEFSAAYEGMTYKDSTDDGEDGSVAGGGSDPTEFSLEEFTKDIELRLAFLSAVAELWRMAAEFPFPKKPATTAVSSAKKLAGDSPESWLSTARGWYEGLKQFVENLHEIEVPDPIGGVDDVMEYDRRRMTKDHLTDLAIDTSVEVGRAIRALAAVAERAGAGDSLDAELHWEQSAGAVERALASGVKGDVCNSLPQLVTDLVDEPLLFVPLSEGGDPQPILRCRSTLALFESLFESLPSLGLIRETYHLVRLAKSMEKNGPESGRRVSEFDRLFRIALRSVVDTLLDAAQTWDGDDANGTETLVETLRKIADSFLTIWVQHSQTLRLTAIEAVSEDSEWEPYRAFIKKYGREIFTAHFLTYGNVRGLLHHGVEEWLDSFDDPDKSGPRPEKLLNDIARDKVAASTAIHYLEITLHTIAEHYEEYRDYNTTTTWSDYGENLYVLLDFLRLKARYERYAWRMRPLVLAHEVLCRKGMPDVAERWEKSIAEFSRPLAVELIDKLAEKEAEHAVRLRTIRDRIEERFLRPLALDRLCALIEPAAKEAREAKQETYKKLTEQLKPLAETPTGVGLDVPQWLRKLGDEVDRVRSEAFYAPKPARQPKLTFAELQRQLDEWDDPLVKGV